MENTPLSYSKSKLGMSLLFLFLFPPIGVYYIWRERKNLLLKFPLLLWISAGYSIISAVGFLGFTSGLGQVPELGMEPSPLLSTLAYFIVFFALGQFAFGFLLDRKIVSEKALPSNYEKIFFLCLLANILIPLLLLLLPLFALKDAVQLFLLQETGM